MLIFWLFRIWIKPYLFDMLVMIKTFVVFCEYFVLFTSQCPTFKRFVLRICLYCSIATKWTKFSSRPEEQKSIITARKSILKLATQQSLFAKCSQTRSLNCIYFQDDRRSIPTMNNELDLITVFRPDLLNISRDWNPATDIFSRTSTLITPMRMRQIR